MDFGIFLTMDEQKNVCLKNATAQLATDRPMEMINSFIYSFRVLFSIFSHTIFISFFSVYDDSARLTKGERFDERKRTKYTHNNLWQYLSARMIFGAATRICTQ